jgi:hypothetical protein
MSASITRGAGLLLAVLGLPAEAAPVPPAEAARVLSVIRQRTQRFHAANSGVADRRRTVVREYDPDTRLLISSKAFVHEHTHYFHDRPSARIQRCKVNGQLAPTGRCASDDLRRRPHVPVFDREGHRHYHVTVAGEAVVAGQRCYRVNVHPLRRTVRHFKGRMYFRTRDLRLLMMEGTVARLPFPVRRVYLKLWFKKKSDLVGIARGYVDVWVRVPLLFARRIVTRFTAEGHRAVPR